MSRAVTYALLLSLLAGFPAEARRRKAKARAKTPAVPKAATARLTESVKGVERACGVKLAASVDWKSFQGTYQGTFDQVTAAGYCSTVLDGLRYLCEDPEGPGKRKLRGLTKVVCRYGRSSKRIRLERRRGTLYAYYHWETPHLADDTNRWLAAQ